MPNMRLVPPVAPTTLPSPDASHRGMKDWTVRVVPEPSGLTFTVVAFRGAQVIRAEKQTPEQVDHFNPSERWAHLLMLGRSKRGLS